MLNSSDSTLKPYDFAVSGAHCVLPAPDGSDTLIIAETSIAVSDGRIAAIGRDVHNKAKTVYNGKGLHVLPGVIDSQVHFREPGLTHKEDLETGTRGAALGGVTCVFEMPNTKPSTTTKELYAEKYKGAEGRIWTDISFFIGATPENIDELSKLEMHPNCCAVKIFMGSSTGTLLIETEENLRRILKHGKRRVAVHAEDEARLRERRSIVEDNPDVRMHPVWRDEQTAMIATERLVRLARETSRPVHVLHITTGEEMAFLKTAKDVATVETTPQHLTLSAPECYERLGTLAQMNPPIREEHHRLALWKAVHDGTVTVLGSDHAPHTLEEKSKPYPNTPSGMTGVQTMLPIMLDHVSKKNLSLERLTELLCRNAARLYGAVGKGELRIGNDADLTIVDLGAQRTISNSWIASRVGWSPYDGVKVKGWPIATMVRGQFVMQNDQLLDQPIGKPVKFSH